MKARHFGFLATCLAILIGLTLLAGASPLEALRALGQGSLGSASAIGGTLRETTPLLIAGAAAYLALQAGLFNIGVEGQFLMGSICSAWVALRVPNAAGVALGVISAMAAGALWAYPAGWIKARRGGHEVITTIMLNSVAAFLTTAIVAGPLKDPSQQSPTTAALSDAARLPWIVHSPTLEVSSGFVFGFLVLAALAAWLSRFVGGYELRAVGHSFRAASLAGIDADRVIVRTMLVSGAIAGFAGAVQVFGYEGRFYADFSQGYGFNSLGVALIAGSQPFAIVPAALFFGILNQGSAPLQLLGIPKGVTSIVLGLCVAAAAVVRYRRLVGAEEPS